MIKTILCALDGSTHADKALALAADLAAKYDARLLLLHVLLRHVEPEELRRFSEVEGLAEPLEQEVKRLQMVDARVEVGHADDVKPISTQLLVDVGKSIVKSATAKATDSGVSTVSTLISDGEPARRILEIAEREKADCIVLGSRGLSDVQAFFEGSVSRKVSNRSACTCITVK